MRFKHLSGVLAGWMEELAQYDMVILHRKGTKHTNADALSRIPSDVPLCNCYTTGCDMKSLPCGGCKFCIHVQSQWEKFEDDVDDILPLAVRQIGSQGEKSCATLTDNSDITDPLDRCLLDDRETTLFTKYNHTQLGEEQMLNPDLRVIIS